MLKVREKRMLHYVENVDFKARNITSDTFEYFISYKISVIRSKKQF